MIVYDDTEPLEKIKIYDKRVEAPPHYDTFGEFHYSYHYGDILSPFVKQEEPLKVECQHFIDCVDLRPAPTPAATRAWRLCGFSRRLQSLKNGGGIISTGH